MARRRRAFSSRSCSFAFFLTDLACFKERTSFVISKFAQSRRRWFTESNLGVSLLASDAEPSDHKSNEESLVLVASDPRSFQIWRDRSSPLPPSCILWIETPPRKEPPLLFQTSHRAAGDGSPVQNPVSPCLALMQNLPTTKRTAKAWLWWPTALDLFRSSKHVLPPPQSSCILWIETSSRSISEDFSGISNVSLLTISDDIVSGLVLVAGDSGFSQIWRVHLPTSAILRFFPSFAAVVPAWCFSRNASNSQAAGQNLGFQVMGQRWASQVMGLLLLLDLLGLMDPKLVALQIMGQFLVLHLMGLFWVLLLMGLRELKRLPVPPCFTAFSAHVACRFRHSSPIAILVDFNCRDSHSLVPKEFNPVIATDWGDGPVSLSFHFRVKTQGNLETATLPMLLWSSFAESLLHCGSPKLPRYQISSCRGQREIVFPILLLEGENLSTIFLVFKALVCCACGARSFLELEGGSSETMLSDLFKGSAKWCFVTPAKVANLMIVISALVAVPIANNRSLCVLSVPQGIVPLCSSKFVKVRRLPDDIYGLSVKIACIYPVIFLVCVFRLAFEAAMAGLSHVVTISSFYGVK